MPENMVDLRGKISLGFLYMNKSNTQNTFKSNMHKERERAPRQEKPGRVTMLWLF